MAFLGLDAITIQLLGRWGTDAVLSYLAEAPLSNLGERLRGPLKDSRLAASETASSTSLALTDSSANDCVLASQMLSEHVELKKTIKALTENYLGMSRSLEELSDQVDGIGHVISPRTPLEEWRVDNDLSKVTHRALISLSASPSTWTTMCGWKFAGESHAATYRLEEEEVKGAPDCKSLSDSSSDSSSDDQLQLKVKVKFVCHHHQSFDAHFGRRVGDTNARRMGEPTKIQQQLRFKRFLERRAGGLHMWHACSVPTTQLLLVDASSNTAAQLGSQSMKYIGPFRYAYAPWLGQKKVMTVDLLVRTARAFAVPWFAGGKVSNPSSMRFDRLSFFAFVYFTMGLKSYGATHMSWNQKPSKLCNFSLRWLRRKTGATMTFKHFETSHVKKKLTISFHKYVRLRQPKR